MNRKYFKREDSVSNFKLKIKRLLFPSPIDRVSFLSFTNGYLRAAFNRSVLLPHYEKEKILVSDVLSVLKGSLLYRDSFCSFSTLKAFMMKHKMHSVKSWKSLENMKNHIRILAFVASRLSRLKHFKTFLCNFTNDQIVVVNPFFFKFQPFFLKASLEYN